METLQDDEKKILTQSRRRIEHLQDLYRIPSLADVKYDEWSRVRLDRLLVDHMLRFGYLKSAKELAEEKRIEELVDLDVFGQCQRIADSLRKGDTKEALQWCGENKAALKKIQVCWGTHLALIFMYSLFILDADLPCCRIPWSSNFDYNSTSKCCELVRKQKQDNMRKSTSYLITIPNLN